MPEGLIQRADQYLADKFNKGVLTPDKSAALVANPSVYNHALSKMYVEKYSNSFEDFDKFKSAYQSQHGDPFKKKEPSASSPKVQSFDTESRTQTPLKESLQKASIPTQETPLENFVTPSEGTQFATFQAGSDRQQIPVEQAQEPLGLPYKQQQADALRSEQYSKGLLQNAEQAVAIQDQSAPKPDFSVASESTSAPINKPLTYEQAKATTFGNVPNVMQEALGSANEFLAPLNKAVYDAIPQAVLTLNNIAGYGAEKITGDASPYTFDEYNKAYDSSNIAGKAAMWLTGIREASLWHDFNVENMSASQEFEQSLAGGVSSGFGQAITMLAGAGEVNMISKGKQLLDAVKYANTLSKSTTLVGASAQSAKAISTQPATYVAALQVFNSEFEQAYSQTGDSDTAFQSALINTVGSSGLEAMPIMSFMKRLDKVTGGGIKKIALNGGIGAVQEATTEALQQSLSNMVASSLYDDTRGLTDGLLQSGEIGGLTGLALNVIGAALGAKLRNTTNSYDIQEIKKTQEYVQQKKDSFDKEQDQIAAHIENQLVSLKITEMQNKIAVENIGTKDFANAMIEMQTMPNSDTVTPKTVGITNKINELLTEKQGIYEKVLNVEQQDDADVRASAIDTEIRTLTNTIGEIYANPSKKQIESNTETTDNTVPITPETQSSQTIQEDGRQQETIDTTNPAAEESSIEQVAGKPKKAESKTAGRGKTPLDKRNSNDPAVLSALSHEVSSVEDIALQAFVRGEISPTKEVYNELFKNSTGDKRAAIGIIRTAEKGGKTLDQMAQKLWKNQENDNQYDTTQFKNAIENVIFENVSKKAAATKLNERFNLITEENGKKVDSSGNELFETPHGWLTQDTIDDIQVADELKATASEDEYNQVLEEYDNLSDEDFAAIFSETNAESIPKESDSKITYDNKSADIRAVDSVKLTQGEFEAKHPDQSYETTRQQVFKDTAVAMEENKGSENPENVVMHASGVNIPLNLGNIPEKIKKSWIKTFQKGAGIPYNLVYQMSVKRKSTIDRRAAEVNKLVKTIHKNIISKINKDIDNQIKLNPSEKSTLNLTRPKHDVLPENIAIELNDHFAGRKTTGLISNDILVEIDSARNLIVSLQRELAADGLIDTDLHMGRNEKGEYYVNRTFRKFDDKNWKDKVPQRVMNKAIIVLRGMYNSRDTNVQSLSSKRENRINAAQSKVDQRNTNLEDKRALVLNTINKIDKKIKLSSKNQNIPTQDIDALKDRKEKLNAKFAKLEADTKSKNKKTEYAVKKARKDLENFLRDNKGNTEIDIDGFIERDIQRFITSDPDAYSASASAQNSKIVSSIFKSKSEFLSDNKALRDVMGEVEDPFINILNTAHKMITTIENYKSQKKVKSMGMETLFSTKPSKKFNTELKTPGMPGLTEDGVLYTTPEFAEAFGILESTLPSTTNTFLKTLGDGIGWVKMGKTVMSTPAAVANYVSNTKHIASNGWNPVHAISNYSKLSKAQKVADTKDLLDRGVLSQSIQGRELQDRKEALMGKFSIKETVSRMPLLDVGAKLLGSFSDFHAKVFANGDNYAKYVGFYSELNSLRDIHPQWTEDQLRNEAAIILSKISPTFDMVAPGIEKIRKSNLFSTFATFPAEQIRNKYNVGLLIKEDFQSGEKERMKRGARRLAGQIAGLAISEAIFELSRYFIGAGYEELKDLQIFQSEYSKNNAILYLNKNGDEIEYMDMARTDYDSYLLVGPLIAYLNDDYDKQQFGNALIRSGQAVTAPFTDTNIIAETLADVIYSRKLDTGDPIFSENDTFLEKLKMSSKHALSKLEPTNVKVGRNWLDLADTGKDEYGGSITARTAILKTIGFGGRTLNITKQFKNKYYVTKRQIDNDRNGFERSYSNARDEKEKAKAVEKYRTELIIGVNKIAHLRRIAQQNGGNMVEVNESLSKFSNRLKFAVQAGEVPEFKDKGVVEAGVDDYIQNEVIYKLDNKKQ